MGDAIALIVLLGIGAGLVIAAWSHVSEWLESRAQKKAHGNRQWDPALCDHDWHVEESGTCMPDYSSVGANPQADWRVLRCPHCGAKSFECDTSCPQYDECKEGHEGGSPEPGKITRSAQGMKADGHGVPYAVYDLTDRFGNKRTGYCRIVPVTALHCCPDCGEAVEAVDAARVRPGDVGLAPAAYRCVGCGRREDFDFGIAKVSYEEAALTFDCPEGLHGIGVHRPQGQQTPDRESVCPSCHGRVEFDPDAQKPQAIWIGTDCYGGVDQPEDPWGMWVCTQCGREEEEDFSIYCTHEWETIKRAPDIRFPPGVDICTENLIFANEVELITSRCVKCDKEKTEEETPSTGMPC